MKAERLDGQRVVDAIRKIRAKPPWDKFSEVTLQHKYPIALRHHGDSPAPIAAQESPKVPVHKPTIDGPTRERWVFLLLKWAKEPKRHPAGMSVEQADELINRLIAVAVLWHSHLDQLSSTWSVASIGTADRKSNGYRRPLIGSQPTQSIGPFLLPGEGGRTSMLVWSWAC
jgi:hypothetical protein